MSAVSSAARSPLRLAKKANRQSVIRHSERADGSREVYSVTAPVSVEAAAMHQCSKGGLKAISVPLFTGKTQSPLSSIETATIASRGSPRVLKSALPRKRKKAAMQKSASTHSVFRELL